MAIEKVGLTNPPAPLPQASLYWMIGWVPYGRPFATAPLSSILSGGRGPNLHSMRMNGFCLRYSVYAREPHNSNTPLSRMLFHTSQPIHLHALHHARALIYHPALLHITPPCHWKSSSLGYWLVTPQALLGHLPYLPCSKSWQSSCSSCSFGPLDLQVDKLYFMYVCM